ncbi:hypothetical protein BDN67DRAFT_976507 [Paxillus ammoniavirescens]|nr:hypothetical protein BDN67DRAFT_976507 [Paxillus ammoniavirescens]
MSPVSGKYSRSLASSSRLLPPNLTMLLSCPTNHTNANAMSVKPDSWIRRRPGSTNHRQVLNNFMGLGLGDPRWRSRSTSRCHDLEARSPQCQPGIVGRACCGSQCECISSSPRTTSISWTCRTDLANFGAKADACVEAQSHCLSHQSNRMVKEL